jgi:endoglucanase
VAHDVGSSATRCAQSINAIRAAGATNLVLVPGVFWTGAHSWASLNDGMKAIQDSNFAFDMHQV